MRGHACLLLCLLLSSTAEAAGVIGASGRSPNPLVYAPTSTIDKKRWMTEGYANNGGVQMRYICIPGTHNAGSYGITGSGITNEVAQCQELSLYEQLNAGHRYVDLRVKKDGSSFYIHHGDVLSVLAQTVFDDIDKFVGENPKEIVLVHIQNVDDMSETEQTELANNHIIPTFSSYMAPRSYGRWSTFNKFWNNNKSLMLIWGGSNFATLSDYFWSQGVTMTSTWSNTNSVSGLVSEQLSVVQTARSGRFHVSQFILTPSFTDIIFPPYYGSIEEMTDDKLDHLTFTYELDRSAIASGQRANIVMVDFAAHNDQYGVEACLDVNGISNNYFSLTGVASGLCMDASGWGRQDGTNVVLWNCHGNNNQKWRFDHLSGQIHSRINDTQCLSFQGSTATGTSLVTWTCTEYVTAFDFHTNTLLLRSDNTLGLSGAGTSNGAKLNLNTYTGANNQRFTKNY